MKKFAIVFPVLAAALAMTPTVKADSYTYTISGSNFSATLYLTASPNNANGAPASGIDTITSVAGTFTVNGQTYDINNPIAPETAKYGSDDSSFTTSSDGGFLFDNLLYPGASGNGILDWGGLLVDNAGEPGYELNIFSGSKGSGAPTGSDSLYFYFADNGNNHSNNRIPTAVGGDSPADATLVATPEPGSLFLLGTGLLGLAFVVFRKARPSGHALNA